MPTTSDFLPFASAPDANVATQAQWIADPVVPEGFTTGILPSAKTNKALRQSTFVAAGVAEMMRQALGLDVLDDGNLGLFVARLSSAISSLSGGGGGGGIPEAPSDGQLYGRNTGVWLPAIAKTGGTMTGLLTLSGNPVAPLGAVPKQYADAIGTIAGNAVPRSGGTMTGLLTLSGDPTANLGAVTKQYADAVRTSGLSLAGGTISGTAPGSLTINRNTAALPPATGTPGLWLNFADSDINGNITIDAHGNFPTVFLRRANGIGTSPTAVLNGDVIGNYSWRGYGTSGYTASIGRLRLLALQDFADTAQGTVLDIGTTPVGSTTMVTQVAIGPGVTVGTPTLPAGGMLIGDLNATRIMVNGVAVSAGGGLSDAPSDGFAYGRLSAAWSRVLPLVGGTITGTAPGSLTINRNLAALPPPNGTQIGALWVNMGDNETGGALIDAHGNTPTIFLRRANVGPSAINAGDVIGNYSWRGYEGTTPGYTATPVGRLQLQALDTFTATAQGTELNIGTIPRGGTGIVTQIAIGPGLMVGTPTLPAGGMLLGDLNATRIMVNGVAVSAGGGLPDAPSDGFAYGRLSAAWSRVLPLTGGTISGTAPGALTINRNAAALPPAIGQPGLWLNFADSDINGNITIDEHGNFPTIFLRRANGTGIVPSAIRNGDVIGNYSWRGYEGTTPGYTNSVGRLQLQALQDFTNAAQGTELNIGTTPIGSTGMVTQVAIGPGVTVGGAATTPPGGGIQIGDLNAQRLLVNGVAVTAGGPPEAPFDGFAYGRLNATWSRVLPLAGGTLTGALLLNADPIAALGAATKQMVDLKAPLVSPVLTGNPTGTTPALADNSPSLATTAFVKGQGYATGGPYLPLTGGTISGTAPGALTINRNLAALPPALSPQTAALWLNMADNETGGVLIDAHGNTPIMFLRRANVGPSAINAGDVIGNFSWRGYEGTTPGYTGIVGRLQLQALDTFTSAAQGSELNIGTTPRGGTGMVTQVAIGPGLTVAGGPVPPAGMLLGDLSAQRMISNNFAALSGVQIGSAAFRNSAAGADLGSGGLILSSQIVVNRNTAALPPNPALGFTAMWLNFANNETGNLGLDAHGAQPIIFLRRANVGVTGAPSAINAGDVIGNFTWRGYEGTTPGYTGPVGRLQLTALDTFTATAQGTQLNIGTTPIGGVGTVTTQVAIGPGLTVGTPSSPPPGGMQVGDINCARLFVNGQAVTVP